MFRRLQWKIVVMFVALVMVVMCVISGFIVLNTIRFYEKDFKNKMQTVMGGIFYDAVEDALEDYPESGVSTLTDILNAYSGQLGLGSERMCSVLRARDASEIATTASIRVKNEKTPNIISAMTGKTGDKFKFGSSYMDYAKYVNAGGNDGYIIYVKDTKQSVYSIIKNMMSIIFQAILFGIAASVVLGYFLSRAITTPITVLTEKAEEFASGDFDSNLEITSNDEIGTLMDTFNYMGGIMSSTLNEIAGEKNKIEIILEHVANGIIAFNTEQNIIHINSAAKKLLEIDDIETEKFDALFKKLESGVCMAEFMYLEGRSTVERELVSGNNHIKINFVPFKIEKDKVAGVVCVLEDITEQFNLENSRRKFVAEVSHELKTPLTTIGAYTETLIDGKDDYDGETRETFLKTIQKETIKMTALVKDLLTLSRFDAQKMETNKEHFSIDGLLRDLIETFKIESKSKRIHLEFNLVNDVPMAYGDKFQLERAFKNIISNAIKYTPEGGRVKVFAGCLYNEVYVKVEDNGIGIPKADLPYIFDRFYRVDKARSREQGGTGLGLSISKEIIENHGGDIGIESEYGEYTRVTVKFPLAS